MRVWVTRNTLLKHVVNVGRKLLEQIPGRFAINLETFADTCMRVDQLDAQFRVDQLVVNPDNLCQQVHDKTLVDNHGLVLLVGHATACWVQLFFLLFLVAQGEAVEKVVLLLAEVVSVDGQASFDVND